MTVDGAVTFVDKDEIEEFQRNFFVIHHGHRCFWERQFCGVDFFGGIIERHIGHHFLLSLLAKIFGIDQKQNALGIRIFEQAVNRGDRGVGFARAGCHLDQGARTTRLKRGFQIDDGGFLAIAQVQFPGGQVIGIERRNMVQALAQAGILRKPFFERLGAVKIKPKFLC